MDILNTDLYIKVMTHYMQQHVLPEFFTKLKLHTEKNFSSSRLQIVAERGAYVGKPFSCNNCIVYGFPCNTCYHCAWNVRLHSLQPYMYTCLKNPRDIPEYRELFTC